MRTLMKVLKNLFGNNTKINANNIAVKKADNSADTLDNCIIVDSGSNSNGSWIKWADGTMICTKKIKFTNVVIKTVWGSVYETSSTIGFGDYAQEFIEIPNVSIDLADGSTCFCETFFGRTKASIGYTWLWKPAVEENGTMTFNVIAIGKWK